MKKNNFFLNRLKKIFFQTSTVSKVTCIPSIFLFNRENLLRSCHFYSFLRIDGITFLIDIFELLRKQKVQERIIWKWIFVSLISFLMFIDLNVNEKFKCFLVFYGVHVSFGMMEIYFLFYILLWLEKNLIFCCFVLFQSICMEFEGFTGSLLKGAQEKVRLLNIRHLDPFYRGCKKSENFWTSFLSAPFR